jgi:hypothetical protein
MFIETRYCRKYEAGGTRNTRDRDERCVQDFCVKIRRKTNLEDLGVDGRIILKLILKQYDGKALTGLVTGCCEDGNEHPCA